MSNICIISQNKVWKELLLQSEHFAEQVIIEQAYEDALNFESSVFVLQLASEDAEAWISRYHGSVNIIVLTEKKAKARFELLAERWMKDKSIRIELITLPTRLELIFSALGRMQVTKEPSVPLNTSSNKWQLSSKHGFLLKAEHKISLTDKEVLLLEVLLKHYPKSVGKDRLLKDVWQYGEGIDTHTLQTHIYRLRQKTKDYGGVIVTTEEGYCLKDF